MLKLFSKLYHVELPAELGNAQRQVLFIDRGEVVEILTTNAEGFTITTVTPNNRMDDTPSFFDSVTEETAINIAGFWGCMTSNQIKQYVSEYQENLDIPIEPLEVH
jgi:hypothetical protein